MRCSVGHLKKPKQVSNSQLNIFLISNVKILIINVKVNSELGQLVFKQSNRKTTKDAKRYNKKTKIILLGA